LEYNILKLIIFAAWFFAGIYMLDKINTNPRKWGRADKNSNEEGQSRNEWLTLFFAPVMWAKFFGKKLWTERISYICARTRRKIKYANISIFDSQGAPLFGSDCDNPAIDELKDIINDAIIKRASDIFLDPAGDGQISLRFRIDGSLQTIKNLDIGLGDNVINAIKVASSMDITEKRRPQDGSFSAQAPGEAISFRVATAGAFGGEKMAIRLLGNQNGPKTLEEIGFDANQCDLLKRSLSMNSGMILMCGATGSGKTTTLYALVNNIDYSLKNVISIEDPIERVLPNVSQMEVNAKADITFAKILRNALRQNPDVICLGEIRDEETAEIAVHAAQTGHLIISTVHSNDSVDTLDRLSSLGVPLRSLASTIKIIINQRLVRRLCPHCKQLAARMPKRWYNFFEENKLPYDNLFVSRGCPECNGTGFKGRVACFDILVIDNQIRSILEQSHASLMQIKQIADSRNIVNSLQYQAAKLAADGIVSLEEIDRVTREIDGGL
jgi:type II secretory ATPase GspE/PulE/Tfp pilus assembly ATPase PilB-like protein